MKWRPRTVAFAIVILTSVGVGIYLIEARSQSTEACLDVDSEEREKIRALMLEAIDQAFKEQIIHLFDVWMKDYNRAVQPTRTITGARNAINAHVGARAAVLKFNPPRCGGGARPPPP